MCIICNMPDQGAVWVAEEFLRDYELAQQAMKKASASMLAVSKLASAPEIRARYDQMHKRMVHIAGDWNAVEHQREALCGKTTEA